MKNIKSTIVLFFSLLILSACSTGNDDQSCPESQTISMKINGEVKQFVNSGWGVDLNSDFSGQTLSFNIFSGVINPQQDSYSIILKLPYKKTGTNIIEEFNYFRVQNGSTAEGNFVLGQFESKVTVNKNTCFSATFSGRALIDGNEIIITDGIINHVYNSPID